MAVVGDVRRDAGLRRLDVRAAQHPVRPVHQLVLVWAGLVPRADRLVGARHRGAADAAPADAVTTTETASGEELSDRQRVPNCPDG